MGEMLWFFCAAGAAVAAALCAAILLEQWLGRQRHHAVQGSCPS
jgi:hypothetical protein